jgi:hypothetical protein
MSWVNSDTASEFMDIERDFAKVHANTNLSIKPERRVNGNIVSKNSVSKVDHNAPISETTLHLHDIPSPQGSLESTPRPPTPLSPSPPVVEIAQPMEVDELMVLNKAASPLLSSKELDSHHSTSSPMKYTPGLISPAAGIISQGPTPASREDLNPPLAAPTSPKAFTPVQEEDSSIFLPQYFEFVTQRMEQDRERQRRKEDNSGFIKSSGNWDEEIGQITSTGREYVGDVFENAKVERRNWTTASEYE